VTARTDGDPDAPRQRQLRTRSVWEALHSEGDLVSVSRRPDCWAGCMR